MQNYKVDKHIQILKKFKYFRKSKNYTKICKPNTSLVSGVPFVYGLQILENGYIYREQLDCFRQLLNRSSKKKIKLRVCILPDTPITKKAKGARMGRGKGGFLTYVFRARRGQVIFQFTSILNKYATLRILSHLLSKVSFKCCIVYRPLSYNRYN